MRLNNILFRLGMAPTIPGARQLTRLFFIQLNNCNIHYIADTIRTYYGIHLYSTIHFVTHELLHLGEMAERTKAADC
uniref:ORF76a n=1 Tax=Pinus koraiensis TaxID=88728 RepID=Q85X15_PINKO|nr:ribosomal protein S4 [Pinus koraiensis]AAO74051.1 ORF76a [Pinus koraiensis]